MYQFMQNVCEIVIKGPSMKSTKSLYTRHIIYADEMYKYNLKCECWLQEDCMELEGHAYKMSDQDWSDILQKHSWSIHVNMLYELNW